MCGPQIVVVHCREPISREKHKVCHHYSVISKAFKEQPQSHFSGNLLAEMTASTFGRIYVK